MADRMSGEAGIIRGELRLTGGERRGTKLFTLPGTEIRPALARVRKSIFDILGPSVSGVRVLDLFGGTGSMAFEAVSRGAARAVIFEISPRAVGVLRKNVQKLRWEDRVEIRNDTAFVAADSLRQIGEEVDLVFVDPPYALYENSEDWAKLQATLAMLPLAAGARLLLEHRTSFLPPESLGSLHRLRAREYGGTTVSFYGTPE